MNMNKNIIAMTMSVAILISASALPASAVGLGLGVSASGSASAGGVGVGVSAGAALRAQLISKAHDRADQEITRRVNALNALNTRVNAMVRLSAEEKGSLSSTIQSQITFMNNLQAQIATDAAADSTSSLKADIQSITKSYRIFALVIPQGAILAASDRVETIGGLFTSFAAQLQTRITAAQAAGNDMDAGPGGPFRFLRRRQVTI